MPDFAEHDWDHAASVAQRFEAVAAHQPDRLALRDATAGGDSAEFTYAALNAAANRLARAIIARCGPEPAPVGLLLPHGNHLIVALLAALKARKFYVPLDPAYPPARLRAIAADAALALTVTDADHLAPAGDLLGSDGAVCDVAAAAAHAPANLDLPVTRTDLFNITYTSGSTGKPKGVLQTHGNVLHDAAVSAERLGITAADRVALLISVGFGASMSDITAALLVGGTLLPFDVRRHGMTALAAWLRDEAITVYHSVPTVFRHLTAALDDDAVLPALRLVKLGGEPVLRRDVALFRRHFARGCLLRNALGTTETYMATINLIDHDTPVADAIVPVGTAAPGKTITIVDDSGQPLPDGERGVIVVGSRYLSPGYWNDPAQTAAAFRPDPADPAGRLYVTGDLGLRRPDGQIVHLGRVDEQVKVRGNRVESAEIELALLECAGVREATVVAREREPGDLRLVAYVVPDAAAAPDAAALRAALAEQLPDYMVPALFVFLDRLPLLPFGKVNRRALPEPDWTSAPPTPYIPPQTPVEQALAAIWAEVLGCARVGLADTFFDLGGDSLSAMQLLSRVRARWSTSVTTTQLLAAGTVAEMAALLDGPGADQPPPDADNQLARALRRLERF